MNRIQSIGLAFVATLAVGMDVWFFVSRCEFSPAVHVLGTVIAVALQIFAVCIPVVMACVFSDASRRAQWRALGVALLACFLSLPLMEMAFVYGDSVGKAKGHLSVGYRCRLPLFPAGGFTDKSLPRTLERNAPEQGGGAHAQSGVTDPRSG